MSDDSVKIPITVDTGPADKELNKWGKIVENDPIKIPVEIDKTKLKKSGEDATKTLSKSFEKTGKDSGTGFSKGFSLGTAALAGGAVVAIAGAKAAMDFTAETNKMRNQMQFYTGATGDDLTKLSAKAVSTASVFGKEVEETMIATNNLAKAYGVSMTEAQDTVNLGFLKGADTSGEMLTNIEEFSQDFKDAGFELDEMVGYLAATDKAGIMSGKSADAISEFGGKIREMGDSTKAALNGIGLDSDLLQKQLEAGVITQKDVMEITAKQIQKVGVNTAASGAAMADIFGGPTEDAIGLINVMADMDEEIKNVLDTETEYEKTQKARLKTQQALQTSLQDMAVALTPIINELTQVFSTALTPLLASIMPIVSGLLGTVSEVIKGIMPIIIGLLDGIMPVIEMILTSVSDLIATIMPLIVEVFAAIMPVITNILNAVKPLIELIITSVKQLIPPLFELLDPIIEIVNELVEEFVPILVEIFQAVIPAVVAQLKFMITIFKVVLSILKPIVSFFIKFASVIIKTLLPVLTTFYDMMESIYTGLTNMVKGIAEFFGIIGKEAPVAMDKVTVGNTKMSQAIEDGTLVTREATKVQGDAIPVLDMYGNEIEIAGDKTKTFGTKTSTATGSTKTLAQKLADVNKQLAAMILAGNTSGPAFDTLVKKGGEYRIELALQKQAAENAKKAIDEYLESLQPKAITKVDISKFIPTVDDLKKTKSEDLLPKDELEPIPLNVIPKVDTSYLTEDIYNLGDVLQDSIIGELDKAIPGLSRFTDAFGDMADSIMADTAMSAESATELIAATSQVFASIGVALADANKKSAEENLLTVIKLVEGIIQAMAASIFAQAMASKESVATWGVGGIALAAALTSLMVAGTSKYLQNIVGANDGVVGLDNSYNTKPSGRDSILAMLAPGETVVTKQGTLATGNADAFQWANKTGGSLEDYYKSSSMSVDVNGILQTTKPIQQVNNNLRTRDIYEKQKVDLLAKILEENKRTNDYLAKGTKTPATVNHNNNTTVYQSPSRKTTKNERYRY